MLIFGHSLKTYQRQFGFMPDFNVSTAEEIDFARRYFSFIEITLKDGNLAKKQIAFLKEKLKGLRVFGHLHWDIDLNNQITVLKHFKAYQKIGAKQITIHPQPDMNLKPYLDFCKENHIKLLVENNIHKPFNEPQIFKELFKQYPSLKMTFDWGHSQFKPQLTKEFFNLFAKRIQHIHLHHTHKQEFDHLPFGERAALSQILTYLQVRHVKATITLEIFNQLVNRRSTPLNSATRHQVLLRQLLWSRAGVEPVII